MPLTRPAGGSTRSLLGALAALAALATLVGPVPAAAAGTTSREVSSAAHRAAPGLATRGLYGEQQPTYDGVYRQGLSILALRAAGARQQPAAVRWLLRQQCDNGRWTSFRSSLRSRCAAGDTNATAMAVMALAALGRDQPARAGLDWLGSVQQRDGGWFFSAAFGTTSDVNSTTLVLQAARSLRVPPRTLTRGGRNGYQYLRSMQLRCAEPSATRGALGFSVDLPTANDFATAPALQALALSPLPVAPASSWAPPASRDCAGGTWRLSTRAGAASYLAGVLRAHPAGIPYPTGGVDVGTTANAVLGLVAAGVGRRQVRQGMQVLHRHARAFVVADHATVPGSAALLVLTAHATHGDPRDVAGMDLVRRIRDSMRS